VTGWHEHDCPGCSLVADQVAQVAHLNAVTPRWCSSARDPAAADIEAGQARMGWEMPWYTMTTPLTPTSEWGTGGRHEAFIRDDDNVFGPTSSTTARRGDGSHLGAIRHDCRSGARSSGRTRRRGIPPDPPYEWWELARRIQRTSTTPR